MSTSISQHIAEQIQATANQYHRLILLTGPPRTGKTTALRELTDEHTWPYININLQLSERLLELTARQRAIKVPRILDDIAAGYESDVLILDNTEVLFSPDLQLDPLRLLQSLARNRTIIAAWAGEYDGENLTYAQPAHPEFKRYQKPDAVIVPILNAQDLAK